MKAMFPEPWSKLNVVLSHDWLTGMRGGERVLELLGDGFPSAPIFSLIHNRAAISEAINRHPITTSWLQHAPGVMKWYRYYLPFFTTAVERMRPPAADLLISTSHCIAKGLQSKPGTKHLCYCFTPMRYAWLFYDEYFGGSPLKKAAIKPILGSLRDWDKRTADRVDTFVTLSHHVQARIKKFYGRDADVVYPPVNVDFYTPGQDGHAGFDLIVSALVPYKRLDLAVRVYNRLGYPLKIVGTGTEYDTLKHSAGSNIEFLGWQSDKANLELYRRCRCLIFPGEEDFGIVPVEAQACGRPVIAYGKGGLLETVIENVSGVFFREQTEESLLAAIETCAGRKWNSSVIRNNAERFAPQAFIDGMDRNISKCMKL